MMYFGEINKFVTNETIVFSGFSFAIGLLIGGIIGAAIVFFMYQRHSKPVADKREKQAINIISIFLAIILGIYVFTPDAKEIIAIALIGGATGQPVGAYVAKKLSGGKK
jgi:uncharacterized Tic20 family protein